MFKVDAQKTKKLFRGPGVLCSLSLEVKYKKRLNSVENDRVLCFINAKDSAIKTAGEFQPRVLCDRGFLSSIVAGTVLLARGIEVADSSA